MQTQENNLYYAGFFARLAALSIDSILLGVLLLIIKLPMWLNWLEGVGSPLDASMLFDFSGWDILLYLLTRLYFVVLTYYSGATIGKRLLKLQVVSSDGGQPSFLDILYRETVGKFLSSAPMNMGYALVGLDREKRGIHDMLSDTRVVYSFGEEKKERPIAPASNYGYLPDQKREARESEEQDYRDF